MITVIWALGVVCVVNVMYQVSMVCLSCVVCGISACVVTVWLIGLHAVCVWWNPFAPSFFHSKTYLPILQRIPLCLQVKIRTWCRP